MSDNRPIGIFDSGIGGLTVVKEIFQQLPGERIVYFGDTARVPYGTKSSRVIQVFAVQDAQFLEKQNVKMIIVACHTASSVAIDQLTQKFNIPVLGVVEPGVTAALNITKNYRVGVIGTKGTIMSGTYEKKLKERHDGIEVVSHFCPLFVPLAEEGWLDNEVTKNVANIYLTPLKENAIDTLILGCTHYPLLKPVIQKVLGNDVVLIDSAEETARVVKKYLESEGMINKNENPEHAFFVSDIPWQFQDVGERFLGRKLETIVQVEID
jgi:glutamate racemase